MDWGYFSLNPMHKMITVEAGEGKYELVVLVSASRDQRMHTECSVFNVYIHIHNSLTQSVPSLL